MHVHTPNTKKNDQFKGETFEEKWENFYSAIENYVSSSDERKKVSVIGITDYLSIENYEKVKNDGICVSHEKWSQKSAKVVRLASPCCVHARSTFKPKIGLISHETHPTLYFRHK